MFSIFKFSTENKSVTSHLNYLSSTNPIKMDKRKELGAKIKGFWRILGPGLVTGAADDDPSGIATYSQTGAQFGYGQLWTALYMLPFLMAVPGACARIGLVTGQ